MKKHFISPKELRKATPGQFGAGVSLLVHTTTGTLYTIELERGLKGYGRSRVVDWKTYKAMQNPPKYIINFLNR